MSEMENKVNIRLLDDLVKEMDDHEASLYGQKPQEVASLADKQQEASGGNPDDMAKKQGGMPTEEEMKRNAIQQQKATNPVYLNPDRQKVLDQIDNESAMISPSKSDDFLKGFRGYSKGAKA